MVKISDLGFQFENPGRNSSRFQKIFYQLPLDPPVLIGFLVVPTALAPGLAINFDPCAAPPLGPLLPGLPLFLLFTGNDMVSIFE